jgi:L-arabinose isomerase
MNDTRQTLVAEGQCVAGDTLEIGNANSRFRFPLGASGFLSAWCGQGPAHHRAVCVGYFAFTLRNTAALLNVGFRLVC